MCSVKYSGRLGVTLRGYSSCKKGFAMGINTGGPTFAVQLEKKWWDGNKLLWGQCWALQVSLYFRQTSNTVHFNA